VWVITGISGYHEDKTTWLAAAYTDKKYADKATILLNRLADKLGNVEPDSEQYDITYRQIREYDTHADIREGLYYFTESVKVTV
jgi:hypothetical protein